MKHFGDHFAVFNSRVFLTAIAHELNSIEGCPEFDFVKFYDIIPKESIKDLTPFHKKRYYGYQYEYRVIANLKKNIVNIGDVLSGRKDSMVLPIKEIDRIEYLIK